MQGNGLSVEDAAELARLAGLDVVNYDRERSPAARRLGIRTGVLDRAVAHARSPGSNGAGLGLPRSAEEAVALVDNAIKPELEIRGSDLPAAAAALRDLFATSDDLFDRDGPVKVVRSAEGNAPRVVPLDRHAVVIEAHRVCRPVMITAKGERVPVTLLERVANFFLAMRGEQGLRPLDGTSAAPLLDADGGFRACEGYDPKTALWCAGIPPVVIPERPSLK